MRLKIEIRNNALSQEGQLQMWDSGLLTVKGGNTRTVCSSNFPFTIDERMGVKTL